jgi:hypothetical protein
MGRPKTLLGTAALVVLAVLLPVAGAGAGAEGGAAGASDQRRSLDRAVTRHIAALTACDADALVAGYTRDAKLFFPDGVVVTGRAALQELYDGFVKPQPEGGLCGLRARPVDRFKRGGAIFVKFEVTAPFLAEPYFSTDGYIFRGDRIASEVSTFDASKLKFK